MVIEKITSYINKIFRNEETMVFSFLLLLAFLTLVIFGGILTPFIISIVFSYLLYGLVKNFIKLGLSELASLIITFTIFVVAGLGLLIWLVPLVFQQTQALFLEVPVWLNNLRNFIENLIESNPDLVTSDQISAFFSEFISRLTSLSQGILDASISGIQDTLVFSIYLIMIPVLVYFFLFDRESIIKGLLKLLPKKREMLSGVWTEMDEQLSNYIRGKGIEILIVGFAAALIFVSVGLNYAALLSIIVGFSVLIPFVGAFLVTIPVVVVALLQFGIGFEFYLVVSLYLLLQALDGNLLVPILFSDAVKLHPVVIMLAVFVFGGLFGFWGAFFSIPLATFIKAIWNSWPKEAASDIS
ncbi:AI-2E family transporter [Pseudomonadota bacterium]|nr:AI-2E family transporter [Pseudomonadota bacterium]|tara:strand:+ start:952 stop:2019 length:1068 start_codon:yes stop_codon:yes gene_type:complete